MLVRRVSHVAGVSAKVNRDSIFEIWQLVKRCLTDLLVRFGLCAVADTGEVFVMSNDNLVVGCLAHIALYDVDAVLD